ncbi:MAG: hypothetical protein ACAH59_00925 [Pseudobdellovibrionaceae bacterium]
MKNQNLFFLFGCSLLIIAGCSGLGLTVIHPEDPVEQNKGTMAVDTSGGQVKVVGTYTCKLKSMGNTFSAVGKTEAETRKEVMAKCQDRTMISSCKSEEASCVKN